MYTNLLNKFNIITHFCFHQSAFRNITFLIYINNFLHISSLFKSSLKTSGLSCIPLTTSSLESMFNAYQMSSHLIYHLGIVYDISCAVHKPNQFTGYNMITNSENPLPLLLFHRFQILHQILIFFASILGSPKKPIQLIVYIPIRQNSQCNCSQLQ